MARDEAASLAEGRSRPNRPRHVADPPSQRRPALPLLRQPGRVEAGTRRLPVGRLPAAEIEAAVIDQVRGLLRAPEIVVGTWRASKPKVDGLNEDQVRRALLNLDPLWDEQFPAELRCHEGAGWLAGAIGPRQSVGARCKDGSGHGVQQYSAVVKPKKTPEA